MSNQMTSSSDNQSDLQNERLTELEIRFLRQDQLLEELSQVLYEQQKTIDSLETKMQMLLDEKQTRLAQTVPPHEVPPHY